MDNSGLEDDAEINEIINRIQSENEKNGGGNSYLDNLDFPILDDREFYVFSENVERIKFSINKDAPKLMGIEWASSLEETGKLLKAHGRELSPMVLVENYNDQIDKIVIEAEFLDVKNNAIVRYVSSGINPYDLNSTNSFIFYNPNGNEKDLYLIGIEVIYSTKQEFNNDINLDQIYNEMVDLFISKWNISVSEEKKDEIKKSGNFETEVKDIIIKYELSEKDGSITVSYFNDAMRRYIKSGFFIR